MKFVKRRKGRESFVRKKDDGGVCGKCGVIVNNIRRHLDRGRCDKQHIRGGY